jgi:hypothetical protein
VSGELRLNGWLSGWPRSRTSTGRQLEVVSERVGAPPVSIEVDCRAHWRGVRVKAWLDELA